MTDALLEIDLWDVGQGDCSVIKLPSGGLLIIDVGPKGSPLVDWLNQRTQAPRIEAIVLTHNDADHAGALPSIVREHKHRIGAVWMLLDRNIDDPVFQKIFRAALEGEEEGHYRIRRVEDGQVLWNEDASNTRFRIVHPSFSKNVTAEDPNDTSGVILLESAGASLLAWPGDLQLRTASAVLSPIKPWMISGPHHGGPSDYPSKATRKRLIKKYRAELAQRMADIRAAAASLNSARAFISVGTSNPYHHPRPGYLRLLASVQTRVSCSQLTFSCERKRVLQRKHIVQGAVLLGLRTPRKGVSCRGAMRMYLKNGTLIPDEFDQLHLERVAGLLRPQCLRGRGWRTGDALPNFAG